MGWLDWVGSGQTAGTTGRGLAMEGLRIRFADGAADGMKVWYRVFGQGVGWLGWTSDGGDAGSTGWGIPLQAVEVLVQAADAPAPGDQTTAAIPAPSTLKIVQDGESTTATVSMEGAGALADLPGFRGITVTGTMAYGGKTTHRAERTFSMAELEKGATMDFGAYGPHHTSITASGPVRDASAPSREVAITAHAYNIAPLTASLPVAIFTTDYWVLNHDDQGPIPTMIMLDRPSAYNWDALPEGMYPVPYLTNIKSYSTPAAKAYVKDLVRVSPHSKFNFFLNDNTGTYVHGYVYANQLPEDRYKIVYISDGNMSYTETNAAYAVADPAARHQQMMDEWNASKSLEYASGVEAPGWGWLQKTYVYYAQVKGDATSEWWLPRTDMFTSGDDNVFATETISKDPQLKRVNIANELKELQALGQDKVDAFKRLYNFSDQYFAAAAQQGKRAMLFMGTVVMNEPDFDDYAAMTMAFYGDGFSYFYKGHPATPTSLHPEKQAQLKALGITDVDSNIAAELILFFNPTLELSGYTTSTYASAADGSKKGLWNYSKAQAMGDKSLAVQDMDWYATPVGSATPKAVAALCPQGHRCFLMEFSDPILAEGKWDYGLFDSTTGTLSLLKARSDGTMAVVETRRSPIEAKTAVMRLYNPNSGEHFYTTSASEKDSLVRAGWRDEGVAWSAPATSGVPVMRLYNPNAGDHFYTTSVSEKDHLASVGWRYEGVAFHSAEGQGVPILRVYNPNARCGSHHYTADAAEKAGLVGQGWRDEAIAWYALP